MPLNFHGHILGGNAQKIMSPPASNLEEVAESGLYWSSTILAKMEIDPDLARWCYYRLGLYPTAGIGSAESAVLRTAIWRLVEALYSNWEIVIKHISVKTVEAAIVELHAMTQISKEYPVMLWEYFKDGQEVGWVSRTMARLPSLESIREFYELPHMRAMYINMRQHDFCDDDAREAQKAYRRALAERNKRLNRALKEHSRRSRK
jgi:hypothetical protein